MLDLSHATLQHDMMKIRVRRLDWGTVHSILHVWLFIIIYTEYLPLPCRASSGCSSRLLVDRSLVPDSAYTNSSAIDSRHTASAARDDPMDMSLQERAWCPLGIVHTNLTEYLHVDLGRQVIIKLIITKGRVAQSKGYQTTPFFTIRYRREVDGPWFQYHRDDKTTILSGNRDAMTENYITMEPPILTRFIRIHPYSRSPTTTCLKLELLGCEADGIVEYQIPQGTVLTGVNNLANKDSARFQDTIYDGYRPLPRQDDGMSSLSRLYAQPTPPQSTLVGSQLPHWSPHAPILTGGLGKLTDNDTDVYSTTSHKFVGWKRHYPPTRYDSQVASPGAEEHIRLRFRFDDLYNFTSIRLFVANDPASNILFPGNITIQFGAVGPPESKQHTADPTLPLFILDPKQIDRNSPSGWIHVDLFGASREPAFRPLQVGADVADRWKSCVARYLEIRLSFASLWMAVGEVMFENHKVDRIAHEMWLSHLLHPERRGEKAVGNTTGRGGTPSADEAVSTVLGAGPFEPNPADSSSQLTTYTLTILCSVLAGVILLSLLVWLCSRLLRRHKRRNGEDPSSCCPFPSLPTASAFRRGSKCTQSKMLAANGPLTVTTAHFDCQTASPLGVGGNQEKASGLGTAASLLQGTGNRERPQQHSSPLNSGGRHSNGVGSPPSSTNEQLLTMGHHNQHLQHQQHHHHQQQQHQRLMQQQQQQQQQVSQATAVAALYTNKLMPPQAFVPATALANLQPIFPPGYAQCDLPMGSTYRRILPDNGVYTSLPGSDCDSQPYAHVINPGQLVKVITPEKRLPGLDGMLPLSLPPPPSLPLPPTPSTNQQTDAGRAGRLKSNPNSLCLSASSSSPSEVSASTLGTTTSHQMGNTPGKNSNFIFVGDMLDQTGVDPIDSSGSPLATNQTDPALWSASGNHGNPSYYLPVPSNRRPYDVDDHVLLLPSQPAAHLGQQHFWPPDYQMNPVTGSDYSTVTMGGSSHNPYAPCYGTPRMLTRPQQISQARR